MQQLAGHGTGAAVSQAARPGSGGGARLWEDHFKGKWLFFWRLSDIFEKARLPVGTAGFEPATP